MKNKNLQFQVAEAVQKQLASLAKELKLGRPAFMARCIESGLTVEKGLFERGQHHDLCTAIARQIFDRVDHWEGKHNFDFFFTHNEKMIDIEGSVELGYFQAHPETRDEQAEFQIYGVDINFEKAPVNESDVEPILMDMLK